MSAATILNNVADKFESGAYRWVQDPVSGHDTDGCHCASTAIYAEMEAANIPFPMMMDAQTRLAYLVRSGSSRRLNPFGIIYEWNDAPGRTKAEIVAMLRKAAA